jgi:hypothetical protein
MSKIIFWQFFICNVPKKGTEYYVPQEGTKCATTWHKKTFRLMCHRKAQKDFLTYVPKEGTICATVRHKMCHSTAQKVPQEGTKCPFLRTY